MQPARNGVHSVPGDLTPVVGAAESAPPQSIEKKDAMPDLAYLALTVVCFIVLGLLVKAVEKL
ncbi:hypothetical protein GCM10009830_09970 [Glycomyces endophyticus]|uniref:Uncharacterized protein n=1 Tax=Glycomyces endophyticus TaxID=480996 RepID=A0ABN2G6T3_9ACTN